MERVHPHQEREGVASLAPQKEIVSCEPEGPHDTIGDSNTSAQAAFTEGPRGHSLRLRLVCLRDGAPPTCSGWAALHHAVMGCDSDYAPAQYAFTTNLS